MRKGSNNDRGKTFIYKLYEEQIEKSKKLLYITAAVGNGRFVGRRKKTIFVLNLNLASFNFYL